MNDIKFYMNNPCKILREISNDFCEIEVSPTFKYELTPDMFCTPCQIGGNSTHVCDEYADVIEAFEDTTNKMLVIVETRLLADTPIEINIFKSLDKENIRKKSQINEANLSLEKLRVEKRELERLEKSVEQKTIELNGEMKKLQEQEDEIETKAFHANRRQENINNIMVSIENIENKSISYREYRELLKCQVILEHLDTGGVDNWEWYGESMPSDEKLLTLVSERL